jgi:hypothetical protein
MARRIATLIVAKISVYVIRRKRIEIAKFQAQDELDQ